MEKVEVALDVLCIEVEETFRIDELAEETCLEVEVRTCGTSCITAKTDDVACPDNLVGLAKMATHVAVNCLESVRVTDDDVVAITAALESYDAHFAREGCANGVSHEDLNVCSVVLTAERATIAVVAGYHSAVARHVEGCSGVLHVCQRFLLVEADQRDAVDGTHLSVDGCDIGESVLC